MFTGLIEHAGRVAALDPIEGGYRLAIETAIAGELRDGDSIAVNGVCLTVVGRGEGRFVTEIGPETARVTTLGDLRGGSARQPRAADASRRADGRPLRAGARRLQGRPQGHPRRRRVLVDHGRLRRGARAVLHPEGVGRRRRHQPDRRDAAGGRVRRADHPVHLGAHQPAGEPPGRRREPRSGCHRQVRRPRRATDRPVAGRRPRSRSRCHEPPPERPVASGPGGRRRRGRPTRSRGSRTPSRPSAPAA